MNLAWTLALCMAQRIVASRREVGEHVKESRELFRRPSLAAEGDDVNILYRRCAGLDVHKKAIEWGCKLAGCTVHFVTEGVDEGPIILQAAVPLLDGDTPEVLAARILEQEHKIYPRAIQLFAEHRLRVDGRRVLIEQGKPDGKAIISSS